MTLNSIPPELAEAIKIVQEFSKKIAESSGEDPNKVFAELVNTEDNFRPLHWNGTSECPYYKKYYAEFVRKFMDKAESEGKNILVENKPLKISRYTLIQQFYQGGMYLVERLDPDSKYAHLRARLEFKRHPDGVMVFWKYKVASRVGEDTNYEGIPVDIETGPKIKDDIAEYIESGPDESKFEKTGLALSAEHQEYIRDMCAGVANVLVLICNSNRVVIAKSSYAANAMKEKGE